jgi:hypothetical protein
VQLDAFETNTHKYTSILRLERLSEYHIWVLPAQKIDAFGFSRRGRSVTVFFALRWYAQPTGFQPLVQHATSAEAAVAKGCYCGVIIISAEFVPFFTARHGNVYDVNNSHRTRNHLNTDLRLACHRSDGITVRHNDGGWSQPRFARTGQRLH